MLDYKRFCLFHDLGEPADNRFAHGEIVEQLGWASCIDFTAIGRDTDIERADIVWNISVRLVAKELDIGIVAKFFGFRGVAANEQ